MDEQVGTWTAGRLVEAIRSRELGSRELLEIYLRRIEWLDGPVSSVITLDVERATAAASQADDAVARGEATGPLHGLPVTIKDAIETEGIRSTGGATELRDHVPSADAPAVSALRRAGAIVFGKTNLPRWSGDLQSYNEMFGTTGNPWNTDLTPGGSSGGAAAATAAGFTSFELGTDIAGSVRVPSHLCGVFGLKPSYGLIPQRGYLDHVGGGTTDADINVFGPIARSAEDLDLLLTTLAGPAPEQAPAWRVELPEPTATALRDLRIGLWLDDERCPVSAECKAVLDTMVSRIADAGARVEEAHPPVNFTEQLGVFLSLIGPAISPSLPDEEAIQAAGPHASWQQQQEKRMRLRAVWAEWFASYDVLLCPVMPVAAFPHLQEGEILARRLEIDGVDRPYIDAISWTGLIGVVNLPSAVPPIGRTAEGNMPVGVQVVAPYLHDRHAVRAAGLIAEAAGGYEVPPGF